MNSARRFLFPLFRFTTSLKPTSPDTGCLRGQYTRSSYSHQVIIWFFFQYPGFICYWNIIIKLRISRYWIKDLNVKTLNSSPSLQSTFFLVIFNFSIAIIIKMMIPINLFSKNLRCISGILFSLSIPIVPNLEYLRFCTNIWITYFGIYSSRWLCDIDIKIGTTISSKFFR